MRKYLLASHGTFAEGLKNSLELILGPQRNVLCISAYVTEETDILKEALNIIHSLNPEDELIIFSDILGGSVNNNLISLVQDSGVHLVTGMNLPLVLNIISSDTEPNIKDIIKDSLQQSKEGMLYYNEIEQTSSKDEEF